MESGDVDRREARRRLVEHEGEVGAGEQDRLDAVAALQLGGEAAQTLGVGGIRALGVEALPLDGGN